MGRAWVVLGLVLGLVGTAWAGPFGLWKGMPLSALGKVTKLAPAKYEVESVPKPVAGIETVVVEACAGLGVSWAKAVGVTVSTNTFGDGVKREFAKWEGRLKVKYGEGKHLDNLLSGSIWDEPRDWMEGLMVGDRKLFTLWSTQDPEGGKMIVLLIAKALDQYHGYVAIEYQYDTNDACDAILLKRSAGAL